jgi:glyoxylase I family protein
MTQTNSFELAGVCPMLQVFDMPTSLAFYRDIVGFAIVSNSPPSVNAAPDDFGWAWLRRDGTDIMLNTAYDPDATRPPLPDVGRVAAHEDTVLYFGCRDVDAAYRFLSSRGVRVNPPAVASYGMKQLYVKDPDGFSLCFQWQAESE